MRLAGTSRRLETVFNAQSFLPIHDLVELTNSRRERGNGASADLAAACRDGVADGAVDADQRQVANFFFFERFKIQTVIFHDLRFGSAGSTSNHTLSLSFHSPQGTIPTDVLE